MINSWHSIISIIVFFLTNLSVIFPTHVYIPFPTSFRINALKLLLCLHIISPKRAERNLDVGRNERTFFLVEFPLNFQTTPIIAVLFLLVTKTATGNDVRHGIVGDNGIQPLNIMALFISLAYLTVSLDTTGLFRFLAYWVAKKGASSGRRLYFLLYIFFFVSGIIFGNDPVILSGTPFLAYLTRVSGIVPPTAWIYAQFAVANVASAVFPPSNPTNLVLSGAFSISFISYTAHTILPALAAAVVIFPCLLFVLFRSQELIPSEIDLLDPGDSDYASDRPHRPRLVSLTDKHGAIFGSVLFCATLVVLVATSPLKVPVWELTVPPAIIMLLRDALHDIKRAKGRLVTRTDATRNENSPEALEKSSDTVVALRSSTEPEQSMPLGVVPSRTERFSIFSLPSYMNSGTLPTLYTIIFRLPISLVPFAFSMFIIVETLASRGWVEVFANWWKVWVGVCVKGGDGAAVVGVVGGMLVASALLCNLCGTNIGTTILLTRVLQVWLGSSIATSSASSTTVNSRVRLGSIYALAIGTNFGAFTFTFSASLAGLLWRGILRQKGIMVHQWQFAITNLPIILIAVITAGAVLIGEIFIVSG